MSFRPGARLERRPLHVVFVLDVSGSMAEDGKIEALNAAVAGTLPHLVELAERNPFAEMLVRAIVFSDGARWHLADPVPVEEVIWRQVSAGGFTDLGAALSLLSESLAVPPMPERALPPVLVLISDGRPTDDVEAGLARLLTTPWGRRAVRLAVAVGSDVDLDVLQDFIDDPHVAPFTARDPEQLAYLVRFATVAASRLATATPGSGPEVLEQPRVPALTDGLLVW